MTASFDELVARAESDSRALAQLAVALLAKGDHARALDLANRAASVGADDPETQSILAGVLSKGIPVWHFDLPFDRVRNAAYEAALKRAVKPGLKILEIGTGTGLLAMMAARAGATDVVTCEAVPAIADVAKQIVRANGYADRIRVVCKHSDDLDVEADAGGQHDILVSEILANDLVGEKILPTIERAKRRLLKQNARIIPARAAVCVALAEDAEMPYTRMASAEGFDLSAFNRFKPLRYRLAVTSPRLALRSSEAQLFVFDFQHASSFPGARADVDVAASAGVANCVVQWIRCEMDEAGVIENRPGDAYSNWALDVYPLLEPVQLKNNQIVRIRGAHDRNTLRVWAQTRASV